MKNLSIHITLAVCGLAAAYYVWTNEPEGEVGGDGVTIVDCAPDSLTRLTFTSDRRSAVLEPRGEGEDRAFWVTVERTPENGEATTVEFVTNDTIDEYLGTVAPLVAVRSLGEVEDDVFEELELDEEHRSTLEMVCGSHEAAFHVGASTFGGGDRYAQRANGGPVYLLDGEIVRGLESAEFQLMQRELHAFEMTEVASLAVEAEGQNRALQQRNYRDPQQAVWVDASDPDRINELFANWIDRISRLRVQSYLPGGAAPGSDLEDAAAATPAQPVMLLRWLGEDDAEIGRLEIVKLDLERPVYYARTEATRAWVRIIATTAQQVEDDTRAVLGLPALERAEPAGPEAPEPLAPHGALGMPTPGAPTPTPLNPHGATPPVVPTTPAAPATPAPATPAPATPATPGTGE